MNISESSEEIIGNQGKNHQKNVCVCVWVGRGDRVPRAHTSLGIVHVPSSHSGKANPHKTWDVRLAENSERCCFSCGDKLALN